MSPASRDARPPRGLLAWGLALLLAASAEAAVTSNLSPTPVFAIDGLAHSGPSHQIIASRDERHVITASHDRSIRIWEVATGRLLRRLHVPLQGADDGRIDSLALSPDGQYLAVGGELGSFASDAPVADGDVTALFAKQRAVLVLTLADGRIHHVIAGFTARATSLDWSADGSLLAVGLGGGSEDGVRIYATRSWQPIYAYREFAGDIVSVAFARDNRLVASGRGIMEGRPVGNHIFLFQPTSGGGYGLTARRPLPPGPPPTASWHPAGDALLAGADSLLDGRSLTDLPARLTERAAAPLAADRPVRRLHFAPDGVGVVGASHTREHGTGWLRRWGDTNGGSTRDYPVPDPRIADFVVLSSGAIVYLAEDGSLACLSAEMELLWRVASPLAALGREDLRVSADGAWLSLPTGASTGAPTIAFHLAEARYAAAEAAATRWLAPRDSNDHLFLQAWLLNPEAAVVRRGSAPLRQRSFRLPLIGQEVPLAAAVHASEPALVFGTSEGRLRKASDFGGLLWSRSLGAEVAAVHLIEERGLVVTATRDGFVRLFRWQDGALVLTYHLQPAARKWLAVAFGGYYDAGLGAEDAAGWIVNRNATQVADFFPLSRFRSEYLLPGWMRHALAHSDERQGVLRALQDRMAPTADRQPASAADQAMPDSPDLARLPPVVDVLAPGFEATVHEPQIRLRIKVTTPKDAPVTRLSARVVAQSSAARSLASLPDARGEAELRLDVPEEDSEIRILAENRWGASVPTVVRVRYAGRKTRDDRGILYVLAAGISAYDKPDYRLGYAAKDARDFVASLQGQDAGRLYRKVVSRILTDRAASRAEVELGFAWLRQQVTPRDTVMVFLAGHGINDGRGGYFYLPRDADLERLEDTGVPFRLIRSSLASLPGRTLMFVDTCHSGNVVGSRSRDHTAAINELASAENNIVVFASSTGSQYSLEDPAWGNGAFTKALVEGLRGEADLKRRGRITYKQLDAYVSDRVDELTRGLQTPVTPVLQGVADFTIADVLSAR